MEPWYRDTMLYDREGNRWRRLVASVRDEVGWLAVLVLAGSLGLGGGLSFARAPAAGSSRPGSLVVMAAGSEGDRLLADVVHSQLVDTRTRLQIVSVQQLPQQDRDKFVLARRLGSVQRAVLVFWCYEPFSGFAMLTMFDPKTSGLVLRPVPSCRSPEGTEAVALIVRSSVEALLAGGSIGGHKLVKSRPSPVHRRPSHRPAAMRRPKKTDTTRRDRARRGRRYGPRMEIALAYRLKTFGPKVPLVHEGDLVLWVRFYRNAWLAGGVGLAQPVHGSTGYGSMVMKRYPVSLTAGYLWTGGSWRFGVVSGLGFEYRQMDLRPVEGVTLSQETKSDEEMTWNAGARASFLILGRVRIFLQIGVEAILAGTSVYSFEQLSEAFVGEPRTTTLVSLQPVRFLSVVGVSVAAL